MIGCSNECFLADASKLPYQRQNTMSRLSKVAREFRKSTEDLCKSTSLYKSHDLRQMIKHWRHAAWALLRDHNVLCAVWLSEVLAYHGSDDSLGDYYLIVHNPQIAAAVLSLYGYQRVSWTADKSILSRFQCQRIKLSSPGAQVDVVLLSAAEWCYDLSYDALHDDLCPYLPEFIDAMMELWLRIPPRSQIEYSYLMDFLTTIIHDCYRLNDFGDDVCNNNYSTWLQPHHREVHFDIVARSKGLVKDNLNFQSRHKHHVHKSNLIRSGRYIPRPRRRRSFEPQLPSLVETPEDTKPLIKSPRLSYLISGTSILFPASLGIGIAL